MNKIGCIKFGLEVLFLSIVLYFLPVFSLELKIKLVLLYALMQILVGRYQGKSLLFYEEILRLILSYTGYLVVCFLVVPFNEVNMEITLTILFLLVVCCLFSLVCSRYSHILLRPFFKKNVAIIGIGHTAKALYDVCRANRYSLMDVLCFIDCNDSEYLEENQSCIVKSKSIYKIDDIEEVLAKHNIDTILIAIPELSKHKVDELSTRVRDHVKVVKYLPWIPGTINFDSKIDDFDGLLMISTSTGMIKPLSKFFKRVLDILLALVGIILLIPITLFVWIKNRSQGDKDPLFFTQERIGKDGKIFKLYKFRTMVPNAEQVLEELMEKDPAIKHEYLTNKKLVNDPRITKAGKFLREKSLDEFPQFINVLLGQMSIIGPRPYLPREKDDMGQYYNSVIACTPGLTGMWQTHGRSNVTFEYRLELDDYYYRNWSFWLDITLFVKTIRQVLVGSGAM